MTTPTTVQVKLKLRSDTAANWTSTNPTLLAGELGRETDTGKIKIGDGSTAWTSLAYQPFGAAITNADISATAEIAVSKLADGAARQLLQTAADGTNVEWTSNVDIPGTLDVTGAATFDGAVTISGDLTVNGTTTNINTTNLVVEDKNIIIADVTTPTDTTADGGGLTLKGATDKLIQWLNATGAWTFSEHVDIANGKEYRINGTKVLDATSLGATVASSSLTSVGTIATGTWNASTIAVNKGGTGQTTYTNGQLLIGNTTGNTLTKSTLTAGTGITITNGTGSITIATTALPSTGGTVTGAITAPAFIPNGSTAPTNGLYLPATNSVGLSSDSVPRMIAGSSEAVFNETGADYDFRIEGDLDANLFFVDASTDKVGIGLSTPTAKFHVRPATNSNLRVGDSGAGISLSFMNDLETDYNGLLLTAGTISINTGTSSPVERVAFASNAVVFNETGADYDFRIEGDTNANLFFVDASADRVGIGTNLPSSLLDLGVASAASDGTKGVRITNPAGTAVMFECGSSNDSYVGTTSSSDFSIRTNNTSRIYVKNGGNVGIGSTGPQYPLHVETTATGTAAGDNSAILVQSQASGRDCNIRFGDSVNASARIGYLSNNLYFYVNANERARIDSSGRLLVGTSGTRAIEPHGISTAGTVSEHVFEQTDTDGRTGIAIVSNSDTTAAYGSFLYLARTRGSSVNTNTSVSSGDTLGTIAFAGADGTDIRTKAAAIFAEVDGTPGANDMPGRLVFSTTADGASSPTERMRITSDGRAVFGGLTTTVGNTTSNIIVGTAATTSGSVGIEGVTTLTTLRYHVVFSNGNGRVGSISTDGTATAYTTSSDYRLKENVTAVTDGITRLQQLKPSRFNFIADPSKTVDGFLAHEAAEVVPECVTGEKDAVDDEGNPIYQGIDQSKLVPLLTAALQEAIGEIEALKARLTAAGI